MMLATASACSDGARIITRNGSGAAPFDNPQLVEPVEFFSMSHLVEVSIELDPRDWDALRFEGRDLIGMMDRTQLDYEYTYFDASVTIDGVRHDHVGVRKKGFWGSLSVVRPSFKIDLDRYDSDGSHFGLEKLTLNNDRGDPSRTHECMAYALFARAGVPASRCNLAHVVVNGHDLGTYSNVESIEKQMLARHFADNDGNLYEGQLGDLIRADLPALELKTNKEANDRSDLLRLVEALEADDAVLVEQLGAVLDIDRFRDFWAMELLTGHWDGYTNNANNYMLYHDPSTGRFQFLPWGTDNTFERAIPRGRVYAWGRVAQRLYGLPEQKRLFWARLAELTDSVWDTQALLQHIDQVETFAPDALPRLLSDERRFVSTRAERLRATFGGKAPRPRARTTSPCHGTLSEIRGTFSTTFSATTTGGELVEFQAQLSLDGEALDGATWTGLAGMEAGLPDQVPGIRFVGALGGGREVTLQLYVEPSIFQPGTRRFHGGETYGIINVREAGAERYVAVIGNGTLNLVAASMLADAPVSGNFDAYAYQVGCAWQ